MTTTNPYPPPPPCPVCDAIRLAEGDPDSISVAFAFGLHCGAALDLQFLRDSMCARHRTEHAIISMRIAASLEAR